MCTRSYVDKGSPAMIQRCIICAAAHRRSARLHTQFFLIWALIYAHLMPATAADNASSDATLIMDAASDNDLLGLNILCAWGIVSQSPLLKLSCLRPGDRASRGFISTIIDASFGTPTVGENCGNPPASAAFAPPGGCHNDVTATFKAECQYQHECEVDIRWLKRGGVDPCPGVRKHTAVNYTCVYPGGHSASLAQAAPGLSVSPSPPTASAAAESVAILTPPPPLQPLQPPAAAEEEASRLPLAPIQHAQPVWYHGPQLPWLLQRQTTDTMGSTGLMEVAARVHKRMTITLVAITAGASRWLQNLVASLYLRGIVSVIAVTFDDKSLAHCVSRLYLHCADGAPFLLPGEVVSDGLSHFSTEGVQALLWGRIRVATALLEAGYTVHVMDTDAVVFRNVYLAYEAAVAYTGAALVLPAENSGRPWHAGAASEVYINMAGTRCFYAKPEALPLFRVWRPERLNTTRRHGNDQAYLNSILYDEAFRFCADGRTCDAVKRAGLVPVWRHPSFYGKGQSCTRGEWTEEEGHCAGRLQYLHALCVEGWENKAAVWDSLGLWAVTEDGSWAADSTLFEKCGSAIWEMDT